MTRASCIALVLSIASLAAAQVRAPYLQSPTERSIVIAWRGASAQPSTVCWGSSPSALTHRAGDGTSELHHEVRIEGLEPGAQYYYAAGHGSCPPSSSGDERDRFRTAPPRGSSAPIRMWVVGDSGTGGSRQAEVRDAMLAMAGDRRPDLYLHVGDMAYTEGLESEFDSNFFAMYADVLRSVPCMPAMGNHEGVSSDAATQTGPYYDAYVLPADGSAGGLPSGTEAYYAFDWGNVHFVVLDSHESPREPDGAMLRWLDDDLAATDATWLVAFFHHPPYTDGSHISDEAGQLIEIRENFVPILEAHGVDLVLSGHSHIYERSWLLHGALDTPTTSEGHIADMGDGRIDGDGAYESGAAGSAYVVAGHGGTSVGGNGAHPVMYFTELENGSCVIDVDGPTMTVRNIRYDGEESDHFTLMKHQASLSLTQPMGGETFSAGSIVTIAWTTAGTVDAIRIEASLDGGESWSALIDRAPNEGAYEWTTPAAALDRVRVRISDADGIAIGDTSGEFRLEIQASDASDAGALPVEMQVDAEVASVREPPGRQHLTGCTLSPHASSEGALLAVALFLALRRQRISNRQSSAPLGSRTVSTKRSG